MSDEKLRMQAYYYRFSKTDKRPIDLILSAVACAGKSYHLTEDWLNECQSWTHLRGNTPVDWIQNAADDAAAAHATTRAALDAKEKECELAAKYVEQEYNGASLPDSPVLALLEIARERGKQFERVMSERDTARAELATAREECERWKQHNEFILSRWPDDTPAPVSVTTT